MLPKFMSLSQVCKQRTTYVLSQTHINNGQHWYRDIKYDYFLCTLFPASFDQDNDSKTFIRGGKSIPGRDRDGGPGTGSGVKEVIGGRAGEVYKLDSKAAQGKGKGGPLSEMDRMLEELKVRIKRKGEQ